METKSFRESHPSRLLGADATGKVWDVVIIREGLSKNGNNYRGEVLEAAAPLFEGLRACAYRYGKPLSGGDHFNHLPELQSRQRPGGFIENVVGWFDGVHFGEFKEVDGTMARGLLAKFHVLPAAEWLSKNMLEAFRQGRSDLYEFSIDARGPATPVTINGKPARDVQKIEAVSSTDVVSDGAAGGQVLRLVASMQEASRLGDFLQAQMEEKDISVADMARAAGISPGTVSQILRGDISRPPDRRLRGFASRLRIPLARLMDLIPEDIRESAWTADDLICLIEDHRPQWLSAFATPDDGTDLSGYALLVLEHNLTEAEKVERETPIHATKHLNEVVRGIKTLTAAIEMIRAVNVPEAMKLLRAWIVEYPVPEQATVESERRGFYSYPISARQSGEPVTGPPARQREQEIQTMADTATKPAQEAGAPAEVENKGEVMATEKEQALAKREAALRVREAKLNIEVALTGSELPDAAKARVRTELIAVAESAELSGDKITERVAGEVAYLAEVGVKQETAAAAAPETPAAAVAVAAPAPVVVKPKNMGGAHEEPAVKVGMAECDKWEKAWDGFFEGGKMTDGIAPIGSLHRAFGEMLGGRLGYVDREEMADYIFESIKMAVPRSPRVLPEKHFARLRENFQGMGATNELKEAISTGDFPVAFGQALFRKLQKEYRADSHNDWRQIVSSFENLQDATNVFSIARLGGVEVMPIVAQGAPYEEFTDPTENEEQIVPEKRGKLLKFTWEDALADRIGVLRRVPRILGRSAARTVQQKVWDQIDLNLNTADAVALINAAHNNLVSGNPALSYTAVTDAMELLQVMPEQDSNERLGLEGKLLLVGPKKRNEAFEITDSEAKVTSAEDATVKSIVNALGIRSLSTIGLGRDTAVDTDFRWYLMIDPADGETIAVGFLGGRDRPDIFVQSPIETPISGASFEADALTFKSRLVFGAVAADHRGIVGSLATS